MENYISHIRQLSEEQSKLMIEYEKENDELREVAEQLKAEKETVKLQSEQFKSEKQTALSQFETIQNLLRENNVSDDIVSDTVVNQFQYQIQQTKQLEEQYNALLSDQNDATEKQAEFINEIQRLKCEIDKLNREQETVMFHSDTVANLLKKNNVPEGVICNTVVNQIQFFIDERKQLYEEEATLQFCSDAVSQILKETHMSEHVVADTVFNQIQYLVKENEQLLDEQRTITFHSDEASNLLKDIHAPDDIVSGNLTNQLQYLVGVKKQLQECNKKLIFEKNIVEQIKNDKNQNQTKYTKELSKLTDDMKCIIDEKEAATFHSNIVSKLLLENDVLEDIASDTVINQIQYLLDVKKRLNEKNEVLINEKEVILQNRNEDENVINNLLVSIDGVADEGTISSRVRQLVMLHSDVLKEHQHLSDKHKQVEEDNRKLNDGVEQLEKEREHTDELSTFVSNVLTEASLEPLREVPIKQQLLELVQYNVDVSSELKKCNENILNLEHENRKKEIKLDHLFKEIADMSLEDIPLEQKVTFVINSNKNLQNKIKLKEKEFEVFKTEFIENNLMAIEQLQAENLALKEQNNLIENDIQSSNIRLNEMKECLTEERIGKVKVNKSKCRLESELQMLKKERNELQECLKATDEKYAMEIKELACSYEGKL